MSIITIWNKHLGLLRYTFWSKSKHPAKRCAERVGWMRRFSLLVAVEKCDLRLIEGSSSFLSDELNGVQWRHTEFN